MTLQGLDSLLNHCMLSLHLRRPLGRRRWKAAPGSEPLPEVVMVVLHAAYRAVATHILILKKNRRQSAKKPPFCHPPFQITICSISNSNKTLPIPWMLAPPFPLPHSPTSSPGHATYCAPTLMSSSYQISCPWWKGQSATSAQCPVSSV